MQAFIVKHVSQDENGAAHPQFELDDGTARFLASVLMLRMRRVHVGAVRLRHHAHRQPDLHLVALPL